MHNALQLTSGDETIKSGSKAEPAEKSSEWLRLVALTKALADENLLDVTSMKMSLEINLLCAAGIWKEDETVYKGRLIKLNTQLMYRQQKYNLLREESEGYSKLITLLNSLPPPPEDTDAHIKQITSVIGYFDLDPNRVLDLVLDSFEKQLWNLSFISVLGIFRVNSIVHILGFKFEFYNTAENDSTAAPKSLYSLAVVLIAYELVALTDLLQYLTPSAAVVAERCEALTGQLVSELKSFGVVNLSGKTDSAVSTSAVAAATAVAVAAAPVSNSARGSARDSKDSRDGKSTSGGVQAANTAPQAPVQSPAPKPLSEQFVGGNQLFGLLAAAYELRQLSLARSLTAGLEAAGVALPPSFCGAVRDALIEVILWRLEPFYAPLGFSRLHLARKTAPDSSASRADLPAKLPNQCSRISSAAEFRADIIPMLFSLSHHIGVSAKLFSAVCRVLVSIVQQQQQPCDPSAMDIDGDHSTLSSTAAANVHVSEDILRVISQVLLPGLTRFDKNSPVQAANVWSVIGLIPFQLRFALYDTWKGSGLGKAATVAVAAAAATGPFAGSAVSKSASKVQLKDAALCLVEEKALLATKAQLKRLSKENVKHMARSLSMTTHCCPLISFNHILSSIEVFDNMIPFVVDALKYITDLSRDVMAYLLVVQLQKDSQKLKPGDTHYSDWFSSMARFIATFYRKYPTACLSGLLNFLVRGLCKGESLDLLVLRELLSKMGGCETMLDLSNTQLEGMSGGRALQAETMGAQVCNMDICV